jgi:NADH-quinone oxidoreductase subunit K
MLPLHYMNYFLLLAAALFGIGVIGVIWRRNALIALMSIELMLNAANITLLTFARARHDMHGHALAFLVIAVAAAEAAIGLAIVVGVFRNRRSTNLDDLTLMKY